MAIKEWHADAERSKVGNKVPFEKQQFKLAGYAGTGKTTIIQEVADCEDFGRVRIAAFTGKAAYVLRQKGVPAQTLHSLIYTAKKINGELVFVKVDSLNADLIIIDEASMINLELYEDLLSYGVPVLWVGDPGQLEPVGDDAYVMKQPDVILSEIHRQAKLSKIIEFSVRIRSDMPFKKGRIGDLEIVEWYEAEQRLLEADQVICGFNRTRHMYNQKIRELKGFYGDPKVGERVICLKNNRKFGVFNGMIATIEAIRESGLRRGVYVADIIDEAGQRFTEINMKAKQFGNDKVAYDFSDQDITLWDYGYVITAHKSQGSQWDKVIVFEETTHNWEYKRWAYTAATRAAKHLIYAQ